MHALFQLTYVVENMVNHRVGCLLHTSGTNDADLVNLCEESKTRLFQHLVQQCADQYMCQHCSDHVHDSTSYPNPCRGVQYLYRLRLRSHKLDSRIAGIFLYTLLDLQSNLSPPPPLSLSVSLSVSLMQTHCLKDIGRLCHAGWTIPQHPQEGSVQPGQCPGVCGPVQPPSPVCLGR